MDKDVLRDILSGMYVLSTDNAACLVDTVLQVSSDTDPLISVCVNKNNYTNKMIKKNKKFAISILDMNTRGELIKTFGFKTSKEIDKFLEFSYLEIDNMKVLKDSIGYLICTLEQVIDTNTHNIFIGKVIKKERLSTSKPMSYQYYQENKDTVLKTDSVQKVAYVCTICGYIHEGELPVEFKCPTCNYPKEYFEKLK